MPHIRKAQSPLKDLLAALIGAQTGEGCESDAAGLGSFRVSFRSASNTFLHGNEALGIGNILSSVGMSWEHQSPLRWACHQLASAAATLLIIVA